MKSRYTYLTIGITSTIIIGAFWIFGKISTTILYSEYDTLWSYRRLRPEFIPSTKVEKIISIGHKSSYADISWIKLIQFIGDNIGNGKYLTFTHNILTHITELHPYFVGAYELDLLLAPFIYPDSDKETIKKNEELMRNILHHGEESIKSLCDSDKIQEIANFTINKDLLSNQHLRNPCIDGMIPYYLGYHYSNVFHDGEKSEYYYKIASMQDDAPQASSFLAILAKSSEGDYTDSALSFLLIATEGYDKEPFFCKQVASDIAKDILKKRELSTEWIQEIMKKEEKLQDTKDNTIPESYSPTNCFESTERGIKQLYIAYIAEMAKDHPEIADSRELEKKNILPFTPTIQSQKNFYLIKKDGIWKYRINLEK